MNRLQQAVILAGGLGTRLGQVTSQLPKPLVPIDGKPFLDYLIWNLRRQGIAKLLLTAGFQAEKLQQYAETLRFEKFTVDVIVESEPLGTGGALKNCVDHLSDRFLVCNGDTLHDINIAAFDIICQTTCGLATRYVDDVNRFGAVTVTDGKVCGFNEKGAFGAGLVNSGTYILTKEAVDSLPHGSSSLENVLLPRLSANGQLLSFECDGFFIDIGTPASLHSAQTLIPNWEKKPIAFLDRDGVLNHDSGHVHHPNSFQWTQDAREAVRFLNDSGFYVVLVTNQAGIAKGMYSEFDFHTLTTWMSTKLLEKGAHLDAVYFCPYHEDAVIPEYLINSYYRKPNPGMLFRAMRELPCLPQRSFMVGDKNTDRQAAEAAGVRFCHFQEGSLLDKIASYLKEF